MTPYEWMFLVSCTLSLTNLGFLLWDIRLRRKNRKVVRQLLKERTAAHDAV